MSDDGNDDLFGDEIHANEEQMLASLDGVDEMDNVHWPKRLVEMIDVTASVLQRKYHLDTSRAEGISRDIAISIARYFGGKQFYMPFGTDLERAVRDKAIWQDWRGDNMDEIIRKYRLTQVQIYSIIKRQKQLHLAKVQWPLFSNNDPAPRS